MTSQPSGQAPTTLSAKVDRGVAGSTGAQQCPNCGGMNHARATVCQDCGEPLRNKPKIIRCRQCRHTAPSNLVVCPHCGRELVPAPSRWLMWGAPALLVLLFLALIFGRVRSGPFPLLRGSVERGMALLTDVSRQVDPQASLVMTPVIEEADTPLSPTSAAGGDGDSGSPPAEPESTAAVAAAAAVDTATATAVPPTATATPLPTATATPEPTATETQAPTATTTPTATATRAAATRGAADSSSTTAATESDDGDAENGTRASPPAADEAATGDQEADESEPGDEQGAALLLVPTPTSVPAALVPTATPRPTATPEPVTYTVVAGDTLVVIAAKLGVSTAALMAANDMTADDARRLRPGQALIVPGEEAEESTSPSTRASETGATAGEETATPPPLPTWTPTPAGSAYRLDTPQLRSPEDNTPLSCSAESELNWIAVPFMQSDDQYVMHLGFVSGIDGSGNETVTWILAQPRPANRTSWDMDSDLCSLAPQAFGRQWRWYVEVVDAAGDPVSRPSETWGFSWN